MFAHDTDDRDTGRSDRTPVPHPNQDPLWRNVGRLQYQKGNPPDTYHYHATLFQDAGAIGILTCAHALWDSTTRAAVESGEFFPAFGAPGEPRFAAIGFRARDILIAPSYACKTTLLAHDWAVTRVPRDRLPHGLDPDTMPRLSAQRDHSIEPEMTVRITGYPEPSEHMVYGEGKVSYAINGTIVYDISSDPGYSGSAVVRVDKPGKVIGVHKGAVDGGERGGAMITDRVAAGIRQWLTPR